MIEHLCDRCKRSIDPDLETCFHVSVEISSAVDGSPADTGDDDVDQLSELHQQLEQQWSENESGGAIRGDSSPTAVKLHDEYRLCADCHRQWIQNPVGRDRLSVLGFSAN